VLRRSIGFVILAACLAGGQSESGVHAARQAVCDLQGRILERAQEARRVTGAGQRELGEWVEQRAAAMERLMEVSPESVAAAALSAEEAARIRDVAGRGARLEEYSEAEGELEIVEVDDFESGRAWREYWVSTGSERLRLHPVGREDLPAGCGIRVRVKGYRLGGRIAGTVEADEVQGERALAAGPCTTTGVQRVALLPVEFPGQEPPAVPAAQLQDRFLGTAAPSVRHHWEENSKGKAWAEGRVLPSLKLSKAYNCTQTDQMLEAVILAMETREDLREYRRLVLFFAWPKEGCGYSGLGTVGCWMRRVRGESHQMSVTWVPVPARGLADDNLVHLGVHELGHNLGLGHAAVMDYGAMSAGPPGVEGSSDTYGDPYSPMGHGLAHYTGRQKDQLGWLETGEKRTLEGTGRVVLEPLAAASTGLKHLRVLRDRTADEWIDIEFREGRGSYEKSLPEKLKGSVALHVAAKYNAAVTGAPYNGMTHLLDMKPGSAAGTADYDDAGLRPGERWADPFSDLVVRVSAASGGAQVDVERDPLCVSSLGGERTLEAEAATVSLQAPAAGGCVWQSLTGAPWLAIVAGQQGIGPGEIRLRVEANNTGRARTSWIAVGRRALLIRQKSSTSKPGGVQVLPPEGKGIRARIEADFGSPGGAEELERISLSLGGAPGKAGSCTVEMNLKELTLRLLNDAGDGWLGPFKSSEYVTAQNSACRFRQGYSWLVGGG
jgi:M6 family metalloprotease-like protein